MITFMKKYKPLLTELLEYMARPKMEIDSKEIWYLRILNIIRLWSLAFVFAIFFALISNLLLRDAGYSQEDFKLAEIIADSSAWIILFLVVIWAPVSEEIAFRLWLKFSPFKWALGISFLSLFLILLITPPFIPEGTFILDSWQGIGNSLLLIFFLFVLIFSILNIKKVCLIVKVFFEKHFHIFFYSLALLFALIHITNYDVNLREIWYFAPILIFPQLLLSFVISFVRIKYGFIWALFTHALNNTIAITPILLMGPLLEKDLSALSFSEIFLFLICISFLMFVFFVCLISIFSLFLEFTKRVD